MTAKPALPWSWRALAFAGLVSGGVLIPSAYFVDMQRRGLDADRVFLWATGTVWDLVASGIQVGLIGAVFVCVGFWAARAMRFGAKGFVILTALPTTFFVVSLGIWAGAFAGDRLAYPPTWLMPASIGWSLAAGALAYLLVINLLDRTASEP